MTRQELRKNGFDIEVRPIGDAEMGVWHKTGYYDWVVSAWDSDGKLVHREFSTEKYNTYEDAELHAVIYANLQLN